MKEAIILAGGLGTRLRKVISDVPKPMADINGKPFLWFVMEWLEKYRFSRIVISAGYKADSIIKYFGDSFKNIPISYAIEEKPLGTGGAVRLALGSIAAGQVLIVNGDTWFPIDITRFYSIHEENESLFSVALKRMKNFSRYGSVEFGDNVITRFREKKFCRYGYINGGIYLSSRQFIESKNLPEVFSLEKDLLEQEVLSGIIEGQVFDDPFIDIGIPRDYQVAQKLLKPGNI